jgi:hypothetical protein
MYIGFPIFVLMKGLVKIRDKWNFVPDQSYLVETIRKCFDFVNQPIKIVFPKKPHHVPSVICIFNTLCTVHCSITAMCFFATAIAFRVGIATFGEVWAAGFHRKLHVK